MWTCGILYKFPSYTYPYCHVAHYMKFIITFELIYTWVIVEIFIFMCPYSQVHTVHISISYVCILTPGTFWKFSLYTCPDFTRDNLSSWTFPWWHVAFYGKLYLTPVQYGTRRFYNFSDTYLYQRLVHGTNLHLTRVHDDTCRAVELFIGQVSIYWDVFDLSGVVIDTWDCAQKLLKPIIRILSSFCRADTYNGVNAGYCRPHVHSTR